MRRSTRDGGSDKRRVEGRRGDGWPRKRRRSSGGMTEVEPLDPFRFDRPIQFSLCPRRPVSTHDGSKCRPRPVGKCWDMPIGTRTRIVLKG